VRARAEVLPAGHLEEFLTETARAAHDAMFTVRGLPTSLRNAVWVAAFAQRHRHETVMTSPPPVLQRIVLPLLARFAR
jgi:phytoene/squalene synthetase